jgi:geranylgeranyl diphosphate synthase type I
VPADRSPLDAADLRRRVQVVIDAALERYRSDLALIAPELTELTDALTVLLAGGKRVRPAFAYWGWRAAGGDPADDDAALAAAASLEFLQASALIHDDVMDGSDTRRGQPAVHRRFAGIHRDAQWNGSADSFGAGAAILLGDLCLSWSDETLLASGITTAAAARSKAVYDEMRTEVMAGQYLDLREQALGGDSVDRALRVVRFKAAKYTVERPLHLGAAIADAAAEVVDTFSRYGLPLGEAFQLRDDVLGVFGDPAQTGKPAGDDLREGKRTVLVALTLERATATQAELVSRLLGDPDLDQAGVDALREVITDTGALGAVEELIEQMLADSLSALADADLEPTATTVLADLALAATRRTE